MCRVSPEYLYCWSFDLRDTVLYPIPGDRKIKRYTQELQIEDIDEWKVFYKIRNYHSHKFCHPYKLYGFWNTDTGEEYKAAGGLQLLLDAQVRIDLPTHEYTYLPMSTERYYSKSVLKAGYKFNFVSIIRGFKLLDN
jgi:hypothetical protein